MKIIISRSSNPIGVAARQAIEDAIANRKAGVGGYFPLQVTYNGKTLPFLVKLGKNPPVSSQMKGIKVKADFITIQAGRQMSNLPIVNMCSYFVLDGRDNFKDNGYDRVADEDDCAFWIKAGFKLPVKV